MEIQFEGQNVNQGNMRITVSSLIIGAEFISFDFLKYLRLLTTSL
jgi:hypothetical protein